MQMTCEGLEYIRMIGESLYPHLHLGLGTTKTAQIRVIHPESPYSINYAVARP